MLIPRLSNLKSYKPQKNNISARHQKGDLEDSGSKEPPTTRSLKRSHLKIKKNGSQTNQKTGSSRHTVRRRVQNLTDTRYDDNSKQTLTIVTFVFRNLEQMARENKAPEGLGKTMLELSKRRRNIINPEIDLTKDDFISVHSYLPSAATQKLADKLELSREEVDAVGKFLIREPRAIKLISDIYDEMVESYQSHHRIKDSPHPKEVLKYMLSQSQFSEAESWFYGLIAERMAETSWIDAADIQPNTK